MTAGTYAEPAFFAPGKGSQWSFSTEPFVGGLAGRAERFADLFPGGAFLLASEGDVAACEPVGGSSEAGGGDGEEQVMRVRGRGPATFGLLPGGERELVDGPADKGVGLLVGR